MMNRHRHSNPRPCHHYAQHGFCRFGDRCHYSHETHQQALCHNYLAGNCRYGSNCKFYHPVNMSNENQRTFNHPSKSIGICPRFWSIQNFPLSPHAKPFVPRSKTDSVQAGPSDKKANEKSNDTEESFCPYYTETGKCIYDYGTCPLIHCNYCEMCCRYCLNPYDEQQRKAHKKDCLAEHEKEMKKAFANQLTTEKTCGICMENVWEQAQRFGILNKCKHCYCLRCIRSWRKATGPMQKETTRSCPQCRVVSDFVIPSTLWVEDDADKEELIRTYHANMKEKICKYMRNGDPNECPFGNKCFYKHQLPDGRVVTSGPPRRRRRSPRDYYNLSLEEFISVVPDINLVRIGIGDEDSVGFLFEEFSELFVTGQYSGHYDDFEDEYDESPTDDEGDETDPMEDDLYGIHLDNAMDEVD